VSLARIAAARDRSRSACLRHLVSRGAVTGHRAVSSAPERPGPFRGTSDRAAPNASVDPVGFRRSGVWGRFSPSRATAAPGRPCRNGRRCEEIPIRPIAGQRCFHSAV